MQVAFGDPPEVGSSVQHDGTPGIWPAPCIMADGAYGCAGIMTGHKPAKMLPRHVPSVNLSPSAPLNLEFVFWIFVDRFIESWVSWLALFDNVIVRQIEEGGGYEVQEREKLKKRTHRKLSCLFTRKDFFPSSAFTGVTH